MKVVYWEAFIYGSGGVSLSRNFDPFNNRTYKGLEAALKAIAKFEAKVLEPPEILKIEINTPESRAK